MNCVSPKNKFVSCKIANLCINPLMMSPLLWNEFFRGSIWSWCYQQNFAREYYLYLDIYITFKYQNIVAEQSILDEGIPQIPFSWVHIKFAKKLNFTADSIARMVTPSTLPFNYSSTPKLGLKDTVVWHLTYHDNFGHLLGEHGPTLHNVLCSYMKR